MFDKVVWGNVTVLKLFYASIVFISAFIIAKGLSFYTKRILKDKVGKDHLEIIVKVVSYAIIILGLIGVFGIIGVNIGGLLFAGSIAGIVLGFASQNIVGNFIAGIFLIIERPIKINDQVCIEDVTGFVENIRIISTTIRTYDGIYVRIPNQTVFTTKMTNYVQNIVRRFEYEVGIRYSDDADQAISIIRHVLNEQPFALNNPAPHVFVDNLGDNSVNIIVRVWAPVTEWYSLKMTLLWKIKATLEKHGIEIAFPQRTLWFANELRSGRVKPSQPPSKKP